MRDFSELYYQRPNAADLQRQLKRLIRRFKKRQEKTNRHEIFKEFQSLVDQYNEMKRLALLRQNQSSADFYANELSFYNSLNPLIEELVVDFYELFLSSDLELDPDDPVEVALNQRAVTTLQLYGPHYREALALERQIIHSELRRLKTLKRMLTGHSSDSPKFNAFLRNPDPDLRYQAWQRLSTELIAGESEGSANYLKILRLRQKMQSDSGLESPYNYAAIHSKLYFSEHRDWHQFKQNLTRYFMPLHEAFKQLRVRKLGEDYLQIQNFMTLLSTEGLTQLPQADAGFLKRLSTYVDQRLGGQSLFSDLLSHGYMQELGRLDLDFTEIPLSLPLSKNAVMLHQDFLSCPIDLALRSLLGDFGRTLLLYSSLRNYPGQEIIPEAPFAEAMAELGLVAILNVSPFSQPTVTEVKKTDILMEGISTDELIDLLLARFILLLPSFLQRADFELQVNAYQLNKAQDIAELWKRLSYKYYPELKRSASPAFKYGFDHQLQAELFTHPFSSLELPLALLILLNEQPWHRNNYIIAEKLNRFLLSNRSLSLAKRLHSAGFKAPEGEEFFSRAAFALADRLQL
ncbi:MAG: hypothetical protein Q4P08_03375 [Eubacteriales bacterium]|nr:hypothetical protein [Eubacteriales bacterium]